MPRLKPATQDGLKKVHRYRKTEQHGGMILLRLWVPDPRRPEFAAEAARQGSLLRARHEETEALEFAGSAFAWPHP